MSDLISRHEAVDVVRKWFDKIEQNGDICIDGIISLPSAEPEQRTLTEDDYTYCGEFDPKVKCLSCGHRIAERLLEVYCNIMCKWVNEKDYCTKFEPRNSLEKPTACKPQSLLDAYIKMMNEEMTEPQTERRTDDLQ